MDRVTLRRQFLPILVLLALVAAFIVWSPAAASASTSLVAPTVADASLDSSSSVAAPLAPATVAQTNDAIVRFGEDVVVAPGETYEGLVVFGGDVDVQGTVEGPVVAFGGDVHISGAVTEEVVAFGGRVVFAGTSRVGTALTPGEDGVIAFGGDVTQEPGAEVSGDVRTFSGDDIGSVIGWAVGTNAAEPFRQFFSFGGWVFMTLVFLVLGLVAAALLPNQIRAVGRQLSARPAASLGWGALTFFVIAPLIIVALVISVVGLLVLIPGIPTLLLAYFFAVVSVGTFIAERFVAGRVSDRNQLFLAMAIGVVATSIVSAVPVLGGLLILVMMLFGIGASLMAFGDWRRRRRAAAAVPPGAPVPPGTPLPPGGGVPPYQPAGPAWQSPPPAAQPGGWPPQATQPSGAAVPQGDATTATTQAQVWQPAPQTTQPSGAAVPQGDAATAATQAQVWQPAPQAAPEAAPPAAPDAGEAGEQDVNTDEVVDAGAGGQTPSNEERAADAPDEAGDEPVTPPS
ncbi:MAG: hypothetical protein V2J16_09515 [Thermoleophilia bacterium]|jgi:hypothetical protein|nr:hypothetical protein [Thermoleophilia bacterium]